MDPMTAHPELITSESPEDTPDAKIAELDTLNNILSPREKGHHKHNLPALVPVPILNSDVESDTSSAISTPLYPPPSPFGLCNKSGRLTRRLRSASGLKLHVNSSALRQYTDYDALGTPRTSLFSPEIWTGNTFGPVKNNIRVSHKPYLDEDEFSPVMPILDVLGTKMIDAVTRHTAAMQQMMAFAHSRGQTDNVDFLLKVGEYGTALSSVLSIISAISLNFTGVAASSPLALPSGTAKDLNTDIKNVSASLLPGLEGMFDDAKAHVQRDLARDLFPAFLVHQLSAELQTINSGYSANQLCPGFGDAFCLTFPREEDNPVEFVSDGMACLTGYSLHDLTSQSYRFLQGVGTRSSSLDRIANALSRNEEVSELVLHYKKDERMFWDLLFIAPVVDINGNVRFWLGGQIDVTDMLENQNDVLHLLGSTSPAPDQRAESPWGRARAASLSKWKTVTMERHAERKSQRSMPYSSARSKLFRTFNRRSQSVPITPSTTPLDGDLDFPTQRTPDAGKPVVHNPFDTCNRKSGATSATPPEQQTVLSPYSRFMVLEYVPDLDHNQFPVSMPILSCSPAALDAIGLGPESSSDVLGQDVFDVLSDVTTLCSITKSCRSSVWSSLEGGRSIKIDLTTPSKSKHKARPLLSKKPSLVALAGLGLNIEFPLHYTQAGSAGPSPSLDRMGSNSSGGSLAVSPGNFVSYWTPLKDGLGVTRWVVLILVPDLS